MSLHVRPLLNEEGKRLSRIARRTNNAITLRRAQVILRSAQGFTPPKIADMLGLSVEWTMLNTRVQREWLCLSETAAQQGWNRQT